MTMKPLKMFCSLNMGQSPSSSTYNEEGKGLPFFQGNADFGEIHPTVRVWCSSPVKIAEPGDILISVRAPIGAMNVAVEQCCIGRGLAALTVNSKNCVQKYLFYALQSRLDSLIEQGTGSTFKAISKKVLEETLIPAYEPSEQRRISEILTETDQLITHKKKQLSLFEKLVKSRFVEMFGNYYSSSKNERPLNAICNFIDYRGKTPEKSERGIPLITAKNVKDNAFSIEPQEYIPIENYDLVMTRGVPRVNDVLFTTEAPLGNVCRIPAIYEKFCVGQRIITMQPHRGVINSEYLEYALLSGEFQEKMWQKSSGSTVKGIRSKLLEWLTIPVPPIEKQEQFATFIEQTDKSKFAIQKSLEELETLKKALMQQYFG